MTGLSFRIADLRRPFASAGLDGPTTLMPGMPWNQVPWICECIAPKRPPAPKAERTTSGTLACSFDTYQNFAAWLTRLSLGSESGRAAGRGRGRRSGVTRELG